MNERRQFVITDINQNTVGVYMIGERIYDVLVEEKDNGIRVGDIYVGRVKNVVDNIRAAFVEIKDGVMGYLPLDEIQRKQVKAEQELIVQVKKPAKGTKDAVLSTRPEIVGRYVLYTYDANDTVNPDSTDRKDAATDSGKTDGCHYESNRISVSKKITDEAQRARLRRLAEEYCRKADSQSAGDADFSGHDSGEETACVHPFITIRTNAAMAMDDLILAEMDRLRDEYDRLLLYGKQRSFGTCIYKAPDAFCRRINAYPKEKLDRIITDDPGLARRLNTEIPDIPVEVYEDEAYSLNARYAIETTLNKALERRVWLKSGANLIIDRTEAMTVIDVNTAKAIEGKRAGETTFFKINTEAAAEIARQLRLRNLSGIILVDFIDMKEPEHIEALTALLRRRLKDDPVKASFIDYTALGLVEITRARQSAPLYECLSHKTDL